MIIDCPRECGRKAEDWSIIDGLCSQCRAELARHNAAPLTLTWADIRAERNRLVAETDWTEVSARLSKKQKRAWAKYRDALFDVTTNFDVPASVKWPSPPDK